MENGVTDGSSRPYTLSGVYFIQEEGGGGTVHARAKGTVWLPSVTPFSTEAVLISAGIDAYKERDVAVVDIPGAYLSADMDDYMFVIFRGTMA